jgi:hypothetical protein
MAIYIMERHLRVTHIRAGHVMARHVRVMHARGRHERDVMQGMYIMVRVRVRNLWVGHTSIDNSIICRDMTSK